MDKGAMGLANIELPKKVKYAPHKKKADGGSKMDCVLSSSRRQNRRYDFDTFSVLRADRLSYF